MKKYQWLFWPAGAVILGPAFLAWALDNSPGWAVALTAVALAATVGFGAIAFYRRRWLAGIVATGLTVLSAQALVVGPCGGTALAAVALTAGLIATCLWRWNL